MSKLRCPACLRTLVGRIVNPDNVLSKAYTQQLSVVCNTWPPGTMEADIDHCCCGHPWLETAQEDYAAWLNGETDDERVERRGYPTVAEWRAHQIRTPMFQLDEKSMRQAERRMHRRPVTNDQSDSVSRSMKPSGEL